MDVKIEKLNIENSATIRHNGPYENSISSWQELMSWAKEKNLVKENSIYFGIYHDDPKTVNADDLRCDVGLSIPLDYKTKSEKINFISLADEQKYAKVLHKGAYKNLGETYNYIFKDWAEKNNIIIAEKPCIEIYLNNPEIEKEEDLLTEVCIPIK